MNTVSKSIKRLRLQNNMTQDQLAEKMYVTRQTISNWETEKAQPDLETLTSLAEVFNTDIYDLIYGWPSGGYKKFQSKYIATAGICLSGILIIKIICDYLTDVLPRSYFRWQHIVDTLIPAIEYSLICILIGMMMASIVSLWVDTNLEDKKRIGVTGVIAIAPMILILLEIVIALMKCSFSGLLFYSLFQHVHWLGYLLLLFPIASGICLFVYFNRPDVKTNSRN